MSRASLSPEDVVSLLNEQQLLENADPLTVETDLFACGLDSMALMQLLVLVEARFGLRVPVEAMRREHFATPARLAAFLASNSGVAAAA